MKVVDSGYDEILKCDYELVAYTLGELKNEVKSWYKDIDFTMFNEKSTYHRIDEYDELEIKRSGLVSSYIIAYRDTEYNNYLMDGFNRLFTNYGVVENENTPIYVKFLLGDLLDSHLMYIMFQLNMWKLHGNDGATKFYTFFDRGFRLFIYKKWNIYLYNGGMTDYDKRLKKKSDFDILTTYFKSDWVESDSFYKDIYEMSILMTRETVVEDIKHIISMNNNSLATFNHYYEFLKQFIIFLSSKRLKGNTELHDFQDYLKELYEDKKFFNKLQNMSGTDSTRKNIYKWFRRNEINETV